MNITRLNDIMGIKCEPTFFFPQDDVLIEKKSQMFSSTWDLKENLIKSSKEDRLLLCTNIIFSKYVFKKR